MLLCKCVYVCDRRQTPPDIIKVVRLAGSDNKSQITQEMYDVCVKCEITSLVQDNDTILLPLGKHMQIEVYIQMAVNCWQISWTLVLIMVIVLYNNVIFVGVVKCHRNVSWLTVGECFDDRCDKWCTLAMSRDIRSSWDWYLPPNSWRNISN